ncbi:hypothetical protein CPU12_01930 [Malaciobacter molluscorum LMG 25693]|uniref:Lipoprotein n=1 Tax=Malaciobacter molluscorum LMG 25693 TaxID=870501 RepID=A0A2G1DKP9_9BACT|nr:hypothetical protein [Malaciobacter molluscorum]AXX92605.1 hypothetical protein AMOL_1639 [Malaciobacter molluscorum LMG 25693]PHO19030.1 hypothetical protein CPU12_01930 [Malaciobacter molluscorum LMG 25693]
MRRLMVILCFVLLGLLITGCTKQPSPEEIKAYELRKEKANGFRVHGTIDERLQASLLSTFRSTADPDKIKECSSYNAWRAGSARRRFLDFEIEIIKDTNFDIKIPTEYISKEDNCGMEYVDTEIRIYRKGDKRDGRQEPLISRWILFSTSRVEAGEATNYGKDRYIDGKLVKKGEKYSYKGYAESALHNPTGSGVEHYSSKDVLLYETKKKYFFLNDKLDFKCHTKFEKMNYKNLGYYKSFTCYPRNITKAKGMDALPSKVMDIELHIDVEQNNKQKFLTYEMQKELR